MLLEGVDLGGHLVEAASGLRQQALEFENADFHFFPLGQPAGELVRR